MLASLSIRNIVLIDKLDMTLADGLCVLTGETGAGKSILLDALGLAIGARADQSLVRKGAGKASVTAEFVLADGHPVGKLMAEHDIVEEEGRLLLRQTQLSAASASAGSSAGSAGGSTGSAAGRTRRMSRRTTRGPSPFFSRGVASAPGSPSAS